MERNNDQISSFQLGMILATTMIGVGILTLPRELSDKVGPDSWIIIVLGSILIWILSIFMVKLVQKFPRKTIQAFTSTLVGKFLGTILLIGFCIFYIVFSAFEIRIFGEVTKEYMLLTTPIEIIMITLLLASIYMVRSGIEPIARISQIILPFVTIFAILLVIPVFSEIDMSNFLPVFRTSIPDLLKAIPTVLFSFLGIETILLFSNFVVDVKNIPKNVYGAIAFVAIIYLFITFITVARFGLIETTHIVWPVLEVFTTVELPGAFIENIQIFFIAIWMLSVYITLVVLYYSASLILSYLIHSKEHNYLVLTLLPIIYILALIPDNLALIGDYMKVFIRYMGVLYLIIIPFLLFLISLFRKEKGGKKSA